MMNQYPMYPQFPARKTEIIRVNGRGGVETFQMMPNSEAIFLDTTQPVIWIAQTDGAGFKTYEAYDVTPHKEAQPVDMNSIVSRIERLEARFNEPATTDATTATE